MRKDLDLFLKQGRKRIGVVCAVCRNKEIADLVAHASKKIDSGESQVCYSDLAEWLRQNFKVTFKDYTLRNHVRHHVRGVDRA